MTKKGGSTKKCKPTEPREYPDWLDDVGSLNHDATIGSFPDDCELEWHATVYDFVAWRNWPAIYKDNAHHELKYGVNIYSEHWGMGCAKRTFEEAMNEIDDFRIEHHIPSSNYKVHIQFRPKKVKRDAMQMKLFSTFELTGGNYE